MSSGKTCALITSFALYEHSRAASDPGEIGDAKTCPETVAEAIRSDERIEALTLHKQLYQHTNSGPTDLAQTYITIGQYDQAVAESREAIRLNPNFAPAHRALVWALLRLNHFAEAKDALA